MGNNNTQIRQIRNDIDQIDKRLQTSHDIKHEAASDISRLNDRKKALYDKLNKITVSKKKVTDHARVRYLERVLDFNFDDIDTEILEQKAHTNTVKAGTVVTVITTK